jgi:hypothetical protein
VTGRNNISIQLFAVTRSDQISGCKWVVYLDFSGRHAIEANFDDERTAHFARFFA